MGRWLACDPQAAKYSSYSPYHFGYDNPIITIDPNGEENIVVIGNVDIGAKDRYKFINTGLKKAGDYAGTKETTTIILYTDGMTKEEIYDVYIKAASLTNVNVIQVKDNSDLLTNYLNSKSINKSEITDARKEDQITDITYYGHGYASNEKGKTSSFEPGHGHYAKGTKKHDNLTWDGDDVKKLNPEAFKNVNAEFESCNSATPNLELTSLTEEFANKTGGTAKGWIGKSSYEFIYSIANRLYGKNIYGIEAAGKSVVGGETNDDTRKSVKVTYQGKTK